MIWLTVFTSQTELGIHCAVTLTRENAPTRFREPGAAIIRIVHISVLVA